MQEIVQSSHVNLYFTLENNSEQGLSFTRKKVAIMKIFVKETEFVIVGKIFNKTYEIISKLFELG